tara:strand:- start:26980 stop:27408 length:429 start_codon:yes stop_codon:yes gene_type:complete
MSKLVKTIFDTCIAKIDEKERTSILDKLYAESNNTRAVFLAQAEEVAKTTFEAKESLAKVFSFAEYLKNKVAPFKYSGVVWNRLRMGEDDEVEGVEGIVYAINKDSAQAQIVEKYMYEGNIYLDDFDITEISVKQAKQKVAA